LRRHGINPLRDENVKPLWAKSVIVLSEETRCKSLRDENVKPLRAKSVIVLSEETLCKSFER
jgi:hypothetical protein